MSKSPTRTVEATLSCLCNFVGDQIQSDARLLAELEGAGDPNAEHIKAIERQIETEGLQLARLEENLDDLRPHFSQMRASCNVSPR